MKEDPQKESFSMFRRWFHVFMLCTAMTVTFAVLGLFVFDFSYGEKPALGVTFNKQYATYLGLDWQQAYLAMLDELNVKHLRLSAQWDETEPVIDQHEFRDIEWQLMEAEKRQVDVILVVGRRTPRWPECHDPAWLKDLTEDQVWREQLEFVKTTVTRLRTFPNIRMWQVENEPFVTLFGECPVMSVAQLKHEVALVKSVDNRPVLITDSGELSSWFQAAPIGDQFGHTLYRVVYNDYLGYFLYYLPPAFYRVKAMLVGLGRHDIIVSELQAEPWVPASTTFEQSYPGLNALMTLDKMESNVMIGERTGASALYLWGVEWWYWMKTVKNDSSYWQLAQELFATYK